MQMHQPVKVEHRAHARSPKQQNVRKWNVFISIVCLVSVMVSLYEMFFSSDVPGIIIMRYTLDVFFIMNIVANFFIGYEVHGLVITDLKKVRNNYFSSWFLMDVLSILPLDALPLSGLSQFFQANKCLRVFRMFSILSSFSKEPDINKLHLSVLRLVSIMALCVQTSACLWFHQVCDASYNGHARHCHKTDNWLQLLPQYSSNVTGVTDMDFYATTVYWAIITLASVGYGDIHATTLEEARLATVVMVVGMFAFGMCISSLSSVMLNMVSRRGRFYQRLKAVHHYMQHMELPVEIQTWVHKYYRHLWLYQKGCDISGLLDDLPNDLRSDLSTFCNSSLMEKAVLFKNIDPTFERALAQKFKTHTYIPGQILAKAGEIHHKLYYIKHGEVQVVDDNEILGEGKLFGEVCLLFDIPVKTTVQALTPCEVTVLEREDLFALFAKYPEAGVEISTRATRLLKDFQPPTETENEPAPASNQSIWKRTFHLESDFVKRWKFFFSCCIGVSLFLETWTYFFYSDSGNMNGLFSGDWGVCYLVFDVLICSGAAFDILLNLLIDKFMDAGHWYRRSWNLYYDVFAILPLEFISFAFGGGGHWAVLGLVRLNRLIWIRRIYQYFCQQECDVDTDLSQLRVVKCIFLLVFYIHFCTGLLYGSVCKDKSCTEESWAWNTGLKPTQTIFEHYMSAAYWTVTTMTTIGYGDIVPGSLLEQWLAAFVGLFGLLVLTYIICQMCATVSSENANRETFQNLFSEMRHFMKRNGIPHSLQRRAKSYMNFLWSKHHGVVTPGGPFIMHDLPPGLKQRVLMAEREELLSQIPFFSEAGNSFVQDLVLTSVLNFFPEGEIIQYSKTLTRELFCILSGTCQILTDDLSEAVGHYQKGMFFGEAGFLFGKPATLTIRALTCCQIVVVDFDKIRVLLEKYPLLKSKIEECHTDPNHYKTLLENAEKILKTQCNVQESDAESRQEDLERFQSCRYFKKSKCYVEKFGHIPMYAGSEEKACPQSLWSAILPSGLSFSRWEFFRSMLAVAVSITSSLLFAFLHNRFELWIASYVFLLFCWVDIYLHFRVDFYEDGDRVVDAAEKARHYFKTRFLVDFVTCFPWELVGCLVISPFGENGFYISNEELHIYAYLRIPHIFQLYRIPSVFSNLETDISAERNIITFLKLLLYGALFLHLSTCVVFGIACPAADLNENITDYFLPVIKHNCHPLSWVSHLDRTFNVDFNTVAFQQLYLTSFYFSTTTMTSIGFGDIHPYMTSVRIDMIFIMIVGTVFCGWVSGIVTDMLANTDAVRAAYAQKTESMKLFLKSHKITGNLYDSVIGFFKFRWIYTKGFDQDKLAVYLPASLFSDIATVLYGDFIAKAFGLDIQRNSRLGSEPCHMSDVKITRAGKLEFPVFKTVLSSEHVEQLEADGCFIRSLARRIVPCLYRARDVIYKKGDHGSEMYFIKKGEVEVLSNTESKVLFKLHAGEYFGERSLLFHDPRAATVRAATNCELYVLSRKSLGEVLQYYPSVYSELKSKVDEVEDHREQAGCSSTTVHGSNVQPNTDSMAEDEDRFELPLTPFRILNFIIRIHNRTFDHDDNVRVIFHNKCSMLIAILFWAIVFMPYGYDVNVYIAHLSSAVVFLHLCEIFFKFRISYDGNGKSDYTATSRNYLTRKWGYVFDMICAFGSICLPWIVNARISHLPSIIFLLVVMWREEESVSSNVLCNRIIKSFILTFLFIHVVSMMTILFVHTHGVMPWMAETELRDFTEMYNYATYWVSQMYSTTGYGEIALTHPSELVVCVILMILAKVLEIYKMGLLNATRSNKLKPQVVFEDKLQTIREYMLRENVPTELQHRVTQFYSYQWNRTQGISTERLFSGIPSHLKSQVVARICGKYLRNNQLLSNFSEPKLREVSLNIQFRCFPVGEYLYKEGEAGSGLFFIISGKVDLSRKDENTVQRLSTGETFGLLESAQLETAIAAEYLDVAVLNKIC